MAYYTSNFHPNERGEYNFNPYGYDVVPDQDLVNFSWYEFRESDSTDYHSNSCYGDYDSFVTQSHSSTHHFSEPKFLQYETVPHDSGYFTSQTHYMISYSTAEFNEPEFKEYDPTPYGGGYDITQTYGKPLPPSDETCYPRSTPMPNSLPLNGLSIPSPYGKADTSVKEAKPQIESKQSDVAKDVQKDHIPAAGVPTNRLGEGTKQDVEKPLDSKETEERKESTNGGGHGLPDSDDGNGSGKNGGYCYEYNDKQVVQYPYGYGLEAMDLCESVFGYWPCLTKQIRKNNCNGGGRDEGCNNNPWQGAVDYIFGSPCDGQRLYGYSWYDHQGSYYHQQPYHSQDECEENSWKHDFNIF